jgi:hypothetical protein
MVMNEDPSGSVKKELLNILNTECIEKVIEEVLIYQHFISN